MKKFLLNLLHRRIKKFFVLKKISGLFKVHTNITVENVTLTSNQIIFFNYHKK